MLFSDATKLEQPGVNLDSLPSVLEVKTLLDGRRKEFACRVIERSPEALVVLFVSDREYVVGGGPGHGPGEPLVLPVGTVTFGHFWVARPYNVYHWQTPTGRTLAHYFNLASDTTWGADRLAWRDLTLDLLVLPDAEPRLLDQDELPADLDQATVAAIDRARSVVLAEQRRCIAELETTADRIWPALFGAGRMHR
jgi:hypothetical protein